MIRTLILAIVLFLIGITIAINNSIRTRTVYKAIQDFTPCPVSRDSTTVYDAPNTWLEYYRHQNV